MTRRKGTLRLLAQITGSILLALVILAAVTYGPILAWAWIADMKDERTAREIIDPKAAAYVAEQYPGNDFEVREAYAVFKDNCFRVQISSTSSRDTHFYLDYDKKSQELIRDTYEDLVLSGLNTRDRLAEEYDEAVEGCLDGMEGLVYLTTELCRYDESTTRDLTFSPDGLDPTTLVLDQEYDIHAVGEAYGRLDITFAEADGEIGLARAWERLTELDRLLTEQGIGYYVMKVTLRSEEYPDVTDTFCLYGIQKQDLQREDAFAHLQQMWEEQEAHRQSLKTRQESDG